MNEKRSKLPKLYQHVVALQRRHPHEPDKRIDMPGTYVGIIKRGEQRGYYKVRIGNTVIAVKPEHVKVKGDNNES
jgi:hypothetical protein